MEAPFRLSFLVLFLLFSKGGGTAIQKFDKSLEEFYAMCDQIEMNLVSTCFNP